MENSKITDLMLKADSKEQNKILEHKTAREKKGRKWKPYKYMTYSERKKLCDKEGIKDMVRHVIKY